MPELERDYGVTTLAVFGSYVRGEHRADSDLDVLVNFNRPIGMFGVIDLSDRLSELVGTSVDLTTVRSASSHPSGRRLLQEAVPCMTRTTVEFLQDIVGWMENAQSFV